MTRVRKQPLVVFIALTIASALLVITIAIAVAEPVGLWLMGHADALPIPRAADSR